MASSFMMNRKLSAGLTGWREAIAPLDDHDVEGAAALSEP